MLVCGTATWYSGHLLYILPQTWNRPLLHRALVRSGEPQYGSRGYSLQMVIVFRHLRTAQIRNFVKIYFDTCHSNSGGQEVSNTDSTPLSASSFSSQKHGYSHALPCNTDRQQFLRVTLLPYTTVRQFKILPLLFRSQSLSQ